MGFLRCRTTEKNSCFMWGLTLLSIVGLSRLSFGQSLNFNRQILKDLEDGPFALPIAVDLQPLSLGSLNGFGLEGTEAQIAQALQSLGMHPHMSIKTRSRLQYSPMGLGGDEPQAEITQYDFHAGDTPLCRSSFKTVRQSNGAMLMVGDIPDVAAVMPLALAGWPDADTSFERSIEELKSREEFRGFNVEIKYKTRCYFVAQGQLEPVWNFVIASSGLQYDLYASDQKLVAVYPRYFDATATIQAYDPNSSGSLSNFSVSVSDGGYLTNDYFKSDIASAGESRWHSSSNMFTYPGSLSANFAEASTFAYVNRQLDFAVTSGYKWSGPTPIKVQVRATIGNTVNNALYTPSSDGVTPPMIQVGQGDNVVLQKLEFDSDVVSHEFGHHVVYQSIYSITSGSDALVLHEGLADFQAFARSQDACLGESICPSGTSMSSCKMNSNKCLRSGETTMKYGDATWNAYASSAHIRGQLISGYLWDMRKSGKIPSDTLNKYVFEAIKYLPAAATIKNFVASMLYTAKLNGGTYSSVVEAAGDGRGLSASTLGIDTSNLETTAKAGTDSGSSSSDSSDSKKSGFFGCATIGAGANQDEMQSQSMMLLLLILLAPLVPLRLLPKLHAVRTNRRKNS
jgi:hypothetical protein